MNEVDYCTRFATHFTGNSDWCRYCRTCRKCGKKHDEFYNHDIFKKDYRITEGLNQMAIEMSSDYE